MLVFWDYLVAALVFALIAVVAGVLLAPPDDDWLPVEFLEERSVPRD